MSEMFSKMMITFVAVVSASVLLLSVALPTIGSSNSAGSNQDSLSYNDTSGASASSADSANDPTTTSSLNNTNNTAMPGESDWENLTTFELFELYPALENLTSGTNNDTSVAVNETETDQQLPSPELNQQNETRATTTANATLSDETQQNSTAATTSQLLNQLQSTISSINQSITELKRDMTNTTTISIDQVVVNELAPPSNTSSQDNDSGDSSQANPVFTFSKEITDDLKKDDYIILAHLAPYGTTKGHAKVELKVPCNSDEEPQVKLMAGSIPKLREVDLGKAIETASVKGSDNEVKLSKAGEYCLYHTRLPAEITDVILVNDSGHKLKFSEGGRFYVAMTVNLDSKEAIGS